MNTTSPAYITPDMTAEQRIAARRAHVAKTNLEAAQARAAAATHAAAHLLSASEAAAVNASLTIDLELRPTAADGAAHRAARAIDRRRVGYGSHTDATEAARMVLKATLLAALAAPVAPASAPEPQVGGYSKALEFIVTSLDCNPELDLEVLDGTDRSFVADLPFSDYEFRRAIAQLRRLAGRI